MKNILFSEAKYLKELFKGLDKKISLIFISSAILLVISWYFANPKFFRENFSLYEYNYQIHEEILSFAYWFISDILLLFIIPVILVKLLFKERIKEYGIQLGEIKIGFLYLLVSILLILPIVYLISLSENFTQYFPLMKSAKEDLMIFIVYELMFLAYIYVWEFFFRGFILFGLENKFGYYSIFIQMIPFVLLHTGKPFIETFASILGGLILGYLAIRTRSIFYGFLIHSFLLITLDILAFLNS